MKRSASGDDRRAKRKAEPSFLCKIKYANTLPAIPAEPKFLKCPLDEDRHYKHKQETSLENNFKWDLIPDADVGVSLDLIDIRAYALPDHPTRLDPVDARLCASAVEKKQKTVPAAIPWLRKPQYLANDYSEPIVGVKPPPAPPIEDEEVTFQDYLNWQSQENLNKLVSHINKSFDAAKKPPTHPKNPNLTPVAILPVLPNDDLWGNTYTEVVFDFSPTHDKEKRTSALLKSLPVVAGDAFLGFYVKKGKKAKQADGGEESDEQSSEEEEAVAGTLYSFEREYKVSRTEIDNAKSPYFFIFQDDSVSFAPTKHIAIQRATADEGTKGRRQADIEVIEAAQLSEYAIQLREQAMEALGGEF